MIICVSGTPGTGKTTVAKALAKKLKGTYIDVKQVIKEYGLGKVVDKKRKAAIIDTKKLNKALAEEIKKIEHVKKKEEQKMINLKNKKIHTQKHQNASFIGTVKNKKNQVIIIDSHLSHYLPKKEVDLCIITVTDINTLAQRLKKRAYSKEKIRENLDAEITAVCLTEALEAGHKVMIVDTTKKANVLGLIRELHEKRAHFS